MEGLMALFAAWSVKKGSEIKAPKEAWTLLFILSMMAEMAISIVIYLYFPTAVFEIILLNMFVMMVLAFAFATLYLLGEPKTLDETLAGNVRVRSLIIVSVVALVLLSEVFMAWTFALIGGTASTVGGLQGIFTTITNSSSSFWFVFMNSAEMAITLFFIRDRLPKAFSWLIVSQVVIMVLSPTAIANSVWASVSLAAGSAIMTFLFIYIFSFLHKNQTLGKGILNYLFLLMLAYALMMAGQFIWLLNGDAAVFALSIIVEMVVYFGIVLDEKKLISSKSASWQSMPYWVFIFLLLIFVVEFFMSGVMAIEVYGQGFFNGIISASTTWPLTRILSAGFYVGTMTVFTAWLIKKGSEIKTLIDAGIVLFLLSMVATTFISTVVYLYVQTSVTLLDLVAINMAVAGATAAAALFATRRGNDSLLKNKVGNIRLPLIASIIALVIFSEVFMGWTFALLGGTVSIYNGLQWVYSALIHATSSFWFIFMMSTEMGTTLFFIRNRLPKPLVWIMASQTIIMILSPTAIDNALWINSSLVAGSAVMIFLFIYVFEYLYKNRTTSSGILNYLLFLMLAYALMMAGQFVWLLMGDATVFVVSIIAEMVVYFGILLDERRLVSSKPASWLSKSYWVFGFLGLLFIAEFFMGGVLDIQVYGTGFFNGLMFASTAGSFVNALSAGFFNFIMFFTTITMSPWYLIMMGVEMGALVVFRIKHTRELETKVRLLLMILAYGAYSILLPAFLIPAQLLSKIPWLGWSMGIGSSGAVSSTVVMALLGTFLISGILSFLFGSRQLCSVMCMAPLMYQGTTIDAMNSFSRTSRLACRLHTNKISSAYKVVVSAVWVSLLAAALLSYLTSARILGISVFGMDPAYFLYMFYFGFLWYFIWMMIPFVGTYGCVSTGMCGWGAFNQLVSRAGLFRLKVKDKALCSRCTTKDCSKVCPIGLTDQPIAFADKGEFRNYKCIGDGNCVSACPNKNISFYDVRHWLGKRFRNRDTSAMNPRK
jgi:polyferredoxin